MENAVKPKLLALLEEARVALCSLADSVSDAERHAFGTPQRWALKDLVFHIGVWEARQAEQLAQAARGEKPEKYDNYLELNDQNFLENCDRAWEDVWAEAERRRQELVAQVEAYTEEMLADPERYTWQQGQPVWRLVRGTAYWHTVAHIAQYYSDRSDLANANRIQEELAATLGGPDASPDERGTAQYNLACYYATTGQCERALELLPGAFALRPFLVEWSKKDGDLDPLRERTEFQALYA